MTDFSGRIDSTIGVAITSTHDESDSHRTNETTVCSKSVGDYSNRYSCRFWITKDAFDHMSSYRWAGIDQINSQCPCQYDSLCGPICRIEMNIRAWNLSNGLNILSQNSEGFSHQKCPSGTESRSLEVEMGLYTVTSRPIQNFREVSLKKSIKMLYSLGK
jgi:hypothetical protein